MADHIMVVYRDREERAYINGQRVIGPWRCTFFRGYTSDDERRADEATDGQRAAPDA